MFFFGLMANLDISVVRKCFPDDLSGYYASAHKIGELFIYLPMAIVSVMFPKVSTASERGEKARSLLYASLAYAGGLCVIGGLGCALLPGLVVKLIFGGEFLPGQWMVRVFPFIFTPFSLAFIIINYLIARGRFGFCYPVGGLSVLYVGGLYLWHGSFPQVMTVQFVAGLALLAVVLVYGTVGGRGARAARSAIRAKK